MGLRYVLDDGPGITRRRLGSGFAYFSPSGARIGDVADLARIRSLAIPPAWTRVWISPRADGHLQATGRDARGRKQYRYHARWRQVRDEAKYGRMGAFAHALPRIRRRVRADLAREGLPREKVLATVVRLLETTFMRVGNEEYARDNDSYGATTLRARQARVRGSRLRFDFRGKSGIEHRIELRDRRLAGIVRRMQELPGEQLFRYVDADGEVRSVESGDVNAYLKEAAREDFTSKDFRTWAGTVLALRALCEAPPPRSKRDAKAAVTRAIESVARRLGNTRAVCRKCYIHPSVIEHYVANSLSSALRGRRSPEAAVAALAKARPLLQAGMQSLSIHL